MISEGLRQEVPPFNIRTKIISTGGVKIELLTHITDGDNQTANRTYVGKLGTMLNVFAPESIQSFDLMIFVPKIDPSVSIQFLKIDFKFLVIPQNKLWKYIYKPFGTPSTNFTLPLVFVHRNHFQSLMEGLLLPVLCGLSFDPSVSPVNTEF